MKRNLPGVFFFTSGFLLLISLPNKLSAQISGTSAFMQGLYVEVGINNCGVYGSTEDIRVGPYGAYHSTDPLGLGFIVDHEKDGWDVSTAVGQPPFCGDYFVPGTPEEGFAIQYGDSIYANHMTYCAGFSEMESQIPGSITSYVDTLGVKSVIWEGDLITPFISLHIEQITTLPDTALFFITDVNITNMGTSDISDLYYETNIDPDQDLDNAGTFATYNSVLSSGDTAKVQAIGLACGCYFALTAADSNARASYGNFMINDGTPEHIWNGTGAGYYFSGTDYACDCAVQLVRKMDIAASSTTSYSYARSFNPAASLQAVNYIAGMVSDTTTTTADNIFSLPAAFLIYPNPAASGFRVTLAGEQKGELQVLNTGGQLMSTYSIETAQEEVYVDAKDLNKGLYIVKFVTAGKTYVKTVMVE